MKSPKADGNGIQYGTGFLVGPDMLISNYHVFEGVIRFPHLANQVECKFDYELDEKGSAINSGVVFFAKIQIKKTFGNEAAKTAAIFFWRCPMMSAETIQFSQRMEQLPADLDVMVPD